MLAGISSPREDEQRYTLYQQLLGICGGGSRKHHDLVKGKHARVLCCCYVGMRGCHLARSPPLSALLNRVIASHDDQINVTQVIT